MTVMSSDRQQLTEVEIEKGMTNNSSCVFTIVSKNYLHYAINLMQSVATFLPQVRRIVVLCDRSDGLDVSAFDFELVVLEDLEIPHLDRMLMQYSILELNTAIKPWVFMHLFRTSSHRDVIYFDPDIQLFSSGEPLLERLRHAQILLTPHLTDFLKDDRSPSEVAILQSGTYNLGFLALARSAAADRLLTWWGEKLQRQCIVDIPNGLFTDQKWMDLVPGIFPEAQIVRDPGWNVAYWNLKHRHVEQRDDEFLVNGRPLFFFHFSGLERGASQISKHQDRFTLADLTPACRRVFDIYGQGVDASGRQRYAALPYAFATLHSGVRLPDVARSFLRRTLDWNSTLPDLRSAEGESLLIALLNAPIDSGRPVLTTLAHSLYLGRADLSAAFPDVKGVHRLAYVDWFIHNAPQQAGIDSVFLSPISATLRSPAREEADRTAATTAAAPNGAPGSAVEAGPAAAIPSPEPQGSNGRSFYHRLYRLAWSMRFLARPFLNPEARNRARMNLLRKAYHAELQVSGTQLPGTPPPDWLESGTPAQQSHATMQESIANRALAAGSQGENANVGERTSHGINVIGYLSAESGVGESARSMLRALDAAAIPHAVVNYTVGNASRQNETFSDEKRTGLHYAVNLFHINADQMGVAHDFLGETFFSGRYRIGYWAWELGEFPDRWLSSFSHLDEIWVPSTFCQRAVASKSPVPVVCIPHTVVLPQQSHRDRAAFGLREDSLCFLSMADMFSIPERKNPLGAVEAFIAAFGDNPAAELLVKLSNSEHRKDISDVLRDHAARHPNIHLLDDYLSREQVYSLLDTADCFVSLHRSEGFGLVIAEAMARGKVVIATGWSGNMEFMNVNNSMVVNYSLVELREDHGPYERGQIWAEPDIQDAADKMRQLLEMPALRSGIGTRARQDCARLLSDREIGRQVRTRLDAIERRGRP